LLVEVLVVAIMQPVVVLVVCVQLSQILAVVEL
jgi:hypothetical protein